MRAIQMQRGAVALLDALGFKELAKDENRIEILVSEILRVQDHMRRERKSLGYGPIQMRFMSDTVFLGLFEKDVKAPERDVTPFNLDQSGWAIRRIAAAVSDLIGASASMKHPLAYRGVITYGNFYLARNILVGPAVNEAASLFESADAAIVWLAPSALCIYEKDNLPQYGNRDHLLVEFDVPLRQGSSFSTRGIGPFFVGTQETRPKTLQSILKTFSNGGGENDISVQIKRQHTARFMEKAMGLVDPDIAALQANRPVWLR